MTPPCGDRVSGVIAAVRLVHITGERRAQFGAGVLLHNRQGMEAASRDRSQEVGQAIRLLSC